jgi:hypothetical protein
MPELVSRKEALRRGLAHYFTGVPCKHGHVSPRAVTNWHCVACINISPYRPRKPPSKRENLETVRKLREEFGYARRSMPRAFEKLGFVMETPEAKARSKYLNDLIRNGKNFIR